MPTPIDQHRCFDGQQLRFTHVSNCCQCDMTFSLFLPPQADTVPVPVVYWLSGLTCTDQNFVTKAGAQRTAAELGIAIVAPDTSPRGDQVPNDDAYDLGQGAGFYVNATEAPWSTHYHMYDYILDELPNYLKQHFADQLDFSREAISGHSMGGHGALTLGLRQNARFRAIGAFSAICHPTQSPWGQQLFSTYLGDNPDCWAQHDATLLLDNIANPESLPPIRLEQGGDDEFLAHQLLPDAFLASAKKQRVSIDYHLHPGYDHSYFFIASKIEAHLRFLAQALFADS